LFYLTKRKLKTNSHETQSKNLLEDGDGKYDKLVENYFTEEKVKDMYYDAVETSNSDLEMVHALLENLEEAVEEIEAMVEAIED